MVMCGDFNNPILWYSMLDMRFHPLLLDHGFSEVFSMNGGRDCGDEDDTASCGNTMMVRKMKIKMNIIMNTIMKTVIDGDWWWLMVIDGDWWWLMVLMMTMTDNDWWWLMTDDDDNDDDDDDDDDDFMCFPRTDKWNSCCDYWCWPRVMVVSDENTLHVRVCWCSSLGTWGCIPGSKWVLRSYTILYHLIPPWHIYIYWLI